MASSLRPSKLSTTRFKTAVAPPATTRTTRAAAKAKILSASPALKEDKLRKDKDFPSDTELSAAKEATNSQPILDDDTEPIKAFLRIRPRIGHDDPSIIPYLEHLTPTTVRMNSPSGSMPNQSRYRLSTTPQSTIYSFSHVFEPATTQSEFFTKTTLPLIQDLLLGQNGLLFAYGVSNSGKTHSMQGGNDATSAGIIPRAFDVIFNSTSTLQSDDRYGAARLQGVESGRSASNADGITSLTQDPALADILEDELITETPDMEVDPTVIPVDRNYSYSVWLSYAEVYNEKVYDLLADTAAASSKKLGARSGPTPSSLLLSRKALALKSSPDSDGTQNSGKYVSGLRQIRVRSASQAKALLKLGQLHRKVFGTFANSQSSRSHALVTIKLLRGHRGEYNDPSSIQTSRLTLVDLAGSERTKHTHTTGDRLREAGSINKSLMVLGQCMEVMRTNQKRLAQSLASVGRVDTRDVKKTLALVPFRHSKLTEILMDYFIGDGRVIMIVNVNPYDTGFDENSHVMKFSALAREVLTITGSRKPPTTSRKTVANDSRSENDSHRRKVTISMGGRNRQNETCLDILEEDEEVEEEDVEGDLEKGFVGALFDEIDDLRMQLFEAEMRCAMIEAETREEVMQEMEVRMRNMERTFMKRIMNEVEQNEKKMDAKIDMLQRTGLLGVVRDQPENECEDEDEDEDDEDVPLSDLTADENEEQQEVESSPLDGKARKPQRWPSKFGKPEAMRPLPDAASESEEESFVPGKSGRAPYPIFEEDVKRGATHHPLNGKQIRTQDTELARLLPINPDVEMEDLTENSNLVLPVPKAAPKSDPHQQPNKKHNRRSKVAIKRTV